MIRHILCYFTCSLMIAQTPLYDQLKDFNDIPGRVALWDFNDVTDLLKSTIGPNLEFVGTGSLSVVSAAGYSDDKAVIVPKGSYLRFANPVPANGGSTTFTNEFTIVYDVKFPEFNLFNGQTNNGFYSLLQTSNTNSNDVDFAVNGNGFPWMGGATTPLSSRRLIQDQWYRIAFVAKLGEHVKLYIDGHLIHTYTTGVALNGRISLYPSSATNPSVLLFADDNGDDNPIYVSSVAMYNRSLSETELERMGGYNLANKSIESCPKLVAFLSNSCGGSEIKNEWLLFKTGSEPFQLDSLRFSWSDREYGIVYNAFDEPASGIPYSGNCNTTNCNATQMQRLVNDSKRLNRYNSISMAAPEPNCSPLKNVPANGIIPENAYVIVFSGVSANLDASDVYPIDFSVFCDYGFDVYLVATNNTGGSGSMYNSGVHTLSMSFDGVSSYCTDYSNVHSLALGAANAGELIVNSTISLGNGNIDGDGVMVLSPNTGEERNFTSCIIASELIILSEDEFEIEIESDLLKWNIKKTEGLKYFLIQHATEEGKDFRSGEIVTFNGLLTYYHRIGKQEKYVRVVAVYNDKFTYSKTLHLGLSNPKSFDAFVHNDKLVLNTREAINLEVVAITGNKILEQQILSDNESSFVLPMVDKGLYLIRLTDLKGNFQLIKWQKCQ
ncbi:MAG: LamG-like jellyroll fold domain-containing protein [Cytophagales bacterium]